MQEVARLHADAFNLVADDLFRTIGAFEHLFRARARMPAINAPGRHEPAVVMDRDLAIRQKAVGHVDAIPAAVQACPAAIGRGGVTFNPQREVAFEELVGDIGEARPQRVPVRPVAQRSARNPAKADLEQLEPVARPVLAAVPTRIEQVGAGREPGGVEELRRLLPQQPAQNVEDPAQRVRPARQRRREMRLQQRAFRNAHLDQIVEPVIEQDLRIEDHDHVDAEEHLEHVFIEEKIDRSGRLRVGALEIEHHLVAVAPHGAADLVRAVALAVVANIVLEAHRFFGDGHRQQRLHRAVVARKQFLRGRDINIIAEPLGHLDHAARGNAARGDQGVEVRLAPIGLAGLVHHQLHQVFVIFPALPDLHRRNAHAFFEDRGRADRHRAGDAPADVALVAEHRGVGDQAPVLEHRQHHQPVVRVRNRARAGIGIGQEDHVPVLDRAVIADQEAVDEAAELANDHLAGGIGDQREGVALFADAGRHGGAHQRRVHFDAGIAQRVLDDVERHRVDRDLGEGGGVGFNDLGGHRLNPSP